MVDMPRRARYPCLRKATTGLQILHNGPKNRSELHPAAYPLLTRRMGLHCGKFPSLVSQPYCYGVWRAVQDKSADNYVIEMRL